MRWAWLMAAVLVAGCANASPPPTSLTTWGEWNAADEVLTVNVRTLSAPFTATHCQCDITVEVDDRVLGTWHVTPGDFQVARGSDRLWSIDIPASSVPHCSGEHDFALNLVATVKLADGTSLQASSMLTCTP